MKNLLLVVRWVVGLLFIFSGLIKINDPAGLSYKMQEFFEAGNLHGMNDYALLFAVLMNVFEVLAGIAIIIGWQVKIFSWLLLLLIVFFTFLTGYALFSGKIKACGCFGDCLPITPAQSFGKDLVLLVLILVLLFYQSQIKPLTGSRTAAVLLGLTVFFGFFIQWYVLQHLPFVDCLPYKKGNDIRQQMQMPAGATADSFAIEFLYKKDGRELRFDQANFPDDFDSTYEYINRIDRLVKPGNGLKPAITDFSLQTLQQADSTEAIFQQPGKYILVLIQDGKDIQEWKPAFDRLLPQFNAKQWPVYLVSSEAAKVQEQFPQMQVFSCDATVLKTAARVKPTFFLMQGATIINKHSYLDAGNLVK
ncbi:MAG: DoxX family protein [Sphingobacteriia bacterium]|nr:DoxX family protein [Sphingobacteriia bacterium]